jgi:hypothetical protein
MRRAASAIPRTSARNVTGAPTVYSRKSSTSPPTGLRSPRP